MTPSVGCAGLSAMVLSFVWGCAGTGDPGRAAADRPSVILISVDTLRADRLSLYGYERPTTPHLENVSRSSVVFDRFYHSGGGTLPSHLTMMTSLYPVTHDVTPENGKTLAEGFTTLAEELEAAGFATAGFTDGGWIKGSFGFARGFDVYDDEGGHFERILPRAAAWLEEHHREPFFLFLHTYDVHSATARLPYECPGEYHFRYAAPDAVDFDGCRDGKCASKLLASVNEEIGEGRGVLDDFFSPEEIAFISSLYDGCINYVDDRLADLFGLLRKLDVYESSLIIVTSDHGEEIGEHGMMIHEQGGYEELSRIPLLVKLPRSVKAGLRVKHLAATVDLMPTILALLELPIPPQAQGGSLVPSIFRDQPVREDLHMYSVLLADHFKLFTESAELYDLAEDPAERRNLYHERPELARTFQERWERKVEADLALVVETSSPGEVELSEEDRNRLEALGYLP